MFFKEEIVYKVELLSDVESLQQKINILKIMYEK